MCCRLFFLFKQKTAYEMRISDWSSDVCSSDLAAGAGAVAAILDRANRRAVGGETDVRTGGGEPAAARHRQRLQHPAHAVAISRKAAAHLGGARAVDEARKSTRLKSSHYCAHSMPSSA